MIGKFWEPDNAPTITLYSPVGESYLYHIPFGWILSIEVINAIQTYPQA
jgi:hypothetical protein